MITLFNKKGTPVKIYSVEEYRILIGKSTKMAVQHHIRRGTLPANVSTGKLGTTIVVIVDNPPEA